MPTTVAPSGWPGLAEQARRRRSKALKEGLLCVALIAGSFVAAWQFGLFSVIHEWLHASRLRYLDEAFFALFVASVALPLFCLRRMRDLRRLVRDLEAADDLRGVEGRRLAEGVEAIDAGFALWDADDRLILCNQRYRSLFLETQASVRPGIRFGELMASHRASLERDFPDAPFEEALASRVTTHREGGSTIFPHPGGRWIRCDDRRTSDGGTASLRTDITMMMEREMELAEAVAKAERQAEDLARLADELTDALQTAQTLRIQAEMANHAKSRFLATVSHELRTPLNAIIGFSEVIKDRLLGSRSFDRYVAYSADIHVAGLGLLDTINQILDLSKIEHEGPNSQRNEIDLPALVDCCAEIAKHDLNKKAFLLNIDLPDDLKLLWGDEQGIKKVVMNLLSNAIKYTPECGEITISARNAAVGGLDVQVSDNGIGIPRGEIGRLMRPFERMESGSSASVAGAGLGLSIVKRVMDSHDGSMTIDSELGVGTTVSLWFPDPPKSGSETAPAEKDAQMVA